MKRKNGFIVREIAGRTVALAVGERSKEFHGMITLNQSGLFIWDLLDSDITEEEIVTELMKVYDVDQDRAQADVHALLETLKNVGIVTE